MGPQFIQAKYDKLDNIADRFTQNAESIADMRSRVDRAVQALQGGGWEGKGASAFFSEMENVISPGTIRLTNALKQAKNTTLQIKDILQAAEEAAAKPFRGSGTSSKAVGDDGTTEGETAEANNSPPLANPDFSKVDNVAGTYEEITGSMFIAGDDNTNIHPNDIAQGQLGDCYFLAAVATLADQNPDVIENAIVDNGDGTYTVTFYDRRNPLAFWEPEFKAVEITVSGEFPVQNGNPLFSQPGDTFGDQNELYPMILEKAYAQWHGGYDKIEGGWPDKAMEHLTGVVSERISPKSMSFDDLLRYKNDGSSIAINTHHDWKLLGWDIPDKTDNNPLYRDRGGPLVPGHAHYVIDLDEANRTVTLKNPWGWGRPEAVLTWEEFQDNLQYVFINPGT